MVSVLHSDSIQPRADMHQPLGDNATLAVVAGLPLLLGFSGGLGAVRQRHVESRQKREPGYVGPQAGGVEVAFLEGDVDVEGVFARGVGEAGHAGVVVVLGAEAPVAAEDVVEPEDRGRFVADCVGGGEEGQGRFEGLDAAADGVAGELLFAEDAVEVEVVYRVSEFTWDHCERGWGSRRSHFEGDCVCLLVVWLALGGIAVW